MIDETATPCSDQSSIFLIADYTLFPYECHPCRRSGSERPPRPVPIILILQREFNG